MSLLIMPKNGKLRYEQQLAYRRTLFILENASVEAEDIAKVQTDCFRSWP